MELIYKKKCKYWKDKFKCEKKRKEKEKEKISIFDEDNDVVNSHSYEFQTNRCCYNEFDRVITLKSEHMRNSEEYDNERDETENNLHSLENLLSEERDLDIVFEFWI